MPKVSFARNTHSPLEVQENELLMQALLKAGLPVASSCSGDGICAKCRLQVTAGRENLSPIEETEQFLIERHGLTATIRISCQARVRGDIEIDASYW